MRTGISFTVSAKDRLRLLALIRDRNAPQKHVWRGQIVLLTADGVGTNEIMRRTGTSKTCVWRWQERFADEGFEGLARDKTRPSRVKPLADEIVARVVALTLDPPPGETTHWTGALMAKASGVSVSSVQRIWRRHGLQPHRMRQFKLSNDPKFIEKLRDVVGLYVDPPAHAIVLSLDEKSQIQALDGTVRNLVCGARVDHHALTNLSSNMMANWVFASHHSRGGIFHVCATWRKTRNSNLVAASSVGKCPLVRTARRSFAFKDSMAFVV